MNGPDEDVEPPRGGGTETVRLRKGPAAEYAAGVEAALSDLPPAEVADILDDVASHLADLTGELGTQADQAALIARLGTPTAYAAELRIAAGYPPAPAPGADRASPTVARLAVLGLVGSTLLLAIGPLTGSIGLLLLAALVGLLAVPLLARDGPGVPSVAALPEVRWWSRRPADGTTARAVADFVAALQPAWWVARAVAAAVVVAVALDLGVAVVLLALLGVPISVWLGHRTRRDRRLLWVVAPLNGLAALVLVVGATLAGGEAVGHSSPEAVPVDAPGLSGPYLGDGDVRDIRPVDAAGTPLTGVYLFDQDGRMIDLPQPECDDGTDAPTPQENRPYPRGLLDYDPRTGACIVTPPGPLVVAVPSPTPSAAPTPAAPTR